jgi:hypothetical protein
MRSTGTYLERGIFRSASFSLTHVQIETAKIVEGCRVRIAFIGAAMTGFERIQQGLRYAVRSVLRRTA